MARHIEVTVPSGMRVKFRSVKGKDIDSMRDQRRFATGESITRLLDDCTVEFVDKGIYSRINNFSWADAIVGDRLAGLIGVRQATTGDKYDFRVRCQDNRCGQWIDWEIDLESDLRRVPLSEESKQIFLEGNEFHTSLNGRDIKFKLVTGADQLKVSKVLQQASMKQRLRRRGEPLEGGDEDARSLIALGGRLLAVEGVSEIVPWLEDLDFMELRELIEAMDKHDCGVETNIEIMCTGKQGCGLQQEITLPLDRSFFDQLR